MADIVKVKVKMPRYRIAAVKAAIRIIAPFVRSEKTGQRIGDAMMAWVYRGLRVTAV